VNHRCGLPWHLRIHQDEDKSMLKQILMALVLTLTCMPAFGDELRVMTFNIRFDNPSDGLNNWKFRDQLVSSMFAKHQVDVAGLQEVTHGQLLRLNELLPGYAAVGVGRDDGKTKGEYSPVFYRRDRFELVGNKTVWLSEKPEQVGSKSWDAALPRIATFVWLRDKTNKQVHLIVNTHYDHRGSIARKASSAVIVKWLQRLREKVKPATVTVMGDFNCREHSAPFQELVSNSSLVDSRSRLESYSGPDSTWSGFKKVVPERRIDFVFVDKSMKVLSHLTDPSQVKGRFPSDHLPVIIGISLQK
jgi:endonuclease/exonuclease/phosphatase family metal-dependent hydrolase